MNELVSPVINACWIFGALTVWPVLRFVVQVPAERLRVLKWLFWLQVCWLGIVYSVTRFTRTMADSQWLHNLPLTSLVGTVSWLTVLVALLAISVRSRQNRA
jgi:hypothetical protein